MEHRRHRLTLGRMMGLIGLVALGLAMTRMDSAPAVSLCVFVGCTWYLARRRYVEALAHRAAAGEGEGVEADPRGDARLAVRCVLAAALAIGLPDAAFLGAYYGYMATVRSVFARTPMGYPEFAPGQILIGALVGIYAALQVAAIMRRGLRPTGGRKRARVEREPEGETETDSTFAVFTVVAP
ncbi:MAG: hypothetical protein ACYC61_30520, partial [Isosphaeraceae bacterium]